MSFPLRVFAVDREVFVGEATALTVQSSTGELQVLADHAPLITLLTEGDLVIASREGEQTIPILSGTLEVSPREVTALVSF